jgi:hypothetical protein
MNIEDQNRFAGIPWLWEGEQIRDIQASISVGRTEIRTGSMV